MFAYAGTMEYSRGRRTLERTKRVDLDVNYRSPGPDVPRGEKEGGKGSHGPVVEREQYERKTW